MGTAGIVRLQGGLAGTRGRGGGGGRKESTRKGYCRHGGHGGHGQRDYHARVSSYATVLVSTCALADDVPVYPTGVRQTTGEQLIPMHCTPGKYQPCVFEMAAITVAAIRLEKRTLEVGRAVYAQCGP